MPPSSLDFWDFREKALIAPKGGMQDLQLQLATVVSCDNDVFKI